VLGAIALWIQGNQSAQKLLAAHIRFCFQPLRDEISMGLKGIHAAAAALPRLERFLQRPALAP
jgi:hypothetical protein